MPGHKPPMIALLADAREALEALSRDDAARPQPAQRARIILAAAAGQDTGQIAQHLGLSPATVRRWCQRWRELAPTPLADLGVPERLADVPRPGRPARIPMHAVAQIEALAREAPLLDGRPPSQWSRREIAEEIKRRGIGGQISPLHATRLLRRRIANPP